MSELTIMLLIHGFAQTASLFLLPGAWKVLALPTLLVSLGIWDFFVNGGGYMGDVFLAMGLFWATGYLVGIWLLCGIVYLSQSYLRRRRQASYPSPQEPV